jgi:DNA (cytosine-5)-methyltransferase 1
MVNYTCEKCGKEFTQKSHYKKHLHRKTPCINEKKLKTMIEEVVDKKIKNNNIMLEENNNKQKTIKIKIINKKNEPKIIKYVDLFCGLGAFHNSLSKNCNKKIEYKCVFSCDINEDVRNIYEENHGIKPFGDINKLNISLMPDFDMMCAGFPCQPFSIAGKKKGFEDKNKGDLFNKILEIIDIKKPNTLFFENVKNLHSIHDGKSFRFIKEQILNRGYNFNYKIIDSRYYGSPQSRKRIYIICNKNKPYIFREIKREIVPVSSILDNTNDVFLNYENKYFLEKCIIKNNNNMVYKLINKKTGKGGRQGERVYNIDFHGPTICASSGGPGSKTGLYYVNNKIRKLNITECLRMFGFPDNYKFFTLENKKKMLFFLGNSIVINVLDELIKDLEEIF